MSGLVAQNRFLVSSFETSEREKPVPTGSMNTRSVKSSQVPGLSTSRTGSDALSPAAPNWMRLGPMAPRLR